MNSVRINQNISALNAWRNLQTTDGTMSKSLERLSSGLRINRAADDAAGLAISEKMRGQIKGLNQARTNAQDAISLIQTAEGGLNETHSILQRMRELSVQAASDTSTDADRAQIQKEVDQLASEITRISNTSEFNTKNLLAGGFSGQKFQIGANKGQDISVTVGAMDAFSLNVAANAAATSLGAGLAAVTGASNAGSGLSAATYNVNVDYTAASTNSVVDPHGAATVGGTYTGSADASVRVEVLTVSDGSDGATAGDVMSARWSTDGGSTWTTINANMTDAAANLAGTGMNIQIANDAGNVVGDAITFNAVAAKADVKLQTAALGTDIGLAVTVHNNATSLTIGNTATDGTLDIDLNWTTLADGDRTINMSYTQSYAATVSGNGTITTDAKAAKGIYVNTQARASRAIDIINTAIAKVSDQRSELGAIQNRLEHTIANLGTAAENISAAESRIRDVDMANEMASFTRSQILLQAGTAMMAQANQKPQGILQLLR
jgi:flagellin